VTVAQAVDRRLVNNQALAYYMHLTQAFLMAAGIDPQKFRFRKHASDELAHYATECWDAELYSDRFGWIECVGIADRSAYDLNAHIQSSGVDMYAVRKFDEPKVVKRRKVLPKMDVLGPLFKKEAGAIKAALEAMEAPASGAVSVSINGTTIPVPKEAYDIAEVEEKTIGEKFVPHVIEPSFGIDRVLYFVIEHSYKELTKNEESYAVLSFPAAIAPISVGVFPLIDDDRLTTLAQSIDETLRNACVRTYYDATGTIGRRYARMDEVGTPFCVTVDHESLEDQQVTVRERDSAQQQRVPIEGIETLLTKKLALC
jgi:glycyl-tRNA synthetase